MLEYLAGSGWLYSVVAGHWAALDVSQLELIILYEG